MRIEDAVQKQNITELAHSSLLIAHRLLKVYRAMEIVLVDAVYEDVLGLRQNALKSGRGVASVRVWDYP